MEKFVLVDPDEISYFEILDEILKFTDWKIYKLHYLIPGQALLCGLVELFSDKSVLELLKHVQSHGSCDVYVEHFVEQPPDKDDEVIDLLKPLKVIESPIAKLKRGPLRLTYDIAPEPSLPPNDSAPPLSPLHDNAPSPSSPGQTCAADDVGSEGSTSSDEESDLSTGSGYIGDETSDEELISARETKRAYTEKLRQWKAGEAPHDEGENVDNFEESDSDYNADEEQIDSDDDDDMADLVPEDVAEPVTMQGQYGPQIRELVKELEGIDAREVREINEQLIQQNDEAHSDYYSSDDPGSYIETSDEGDHAQRRRSSCPHFDPKEMVFCVGMEFKSKSEFVERLNEYSITKRYAIRVIKSDSKRCRAVCKSEICKWKIHCSNYGKKATWQVKTYVNEHSCVPTNRNRWVNAKVLAKKWRILISEMPSIKSRIISLLTRATMGCRVDLKQCRLAKQIIQKELNEQYTKEWGLLRFYGDELLAKNPGSTVVVETEKVNEDGVEKNRFSRTYICLKACKAGWKLSCRPIIGLDGAFLKGLARGELLTAVGRDGNDQMFPIAWAVVSLENTDNWRWFINLLAHDLDINDGSGLTIISDMQKVGWFTYSLYLCCNCLFQFPYLHMYFCSL
jgi:hypothetical protein